MQKIISLTHARVDIDSRARRCCCKVREKGSRGRRKQACMVTFSGFPNPRRGHSPGSVTHHARVAYAGSRRLRVRARRPPFCGTSSAEEFMDVLEASMDASKVGARPPAAGHRQVVYRGRVGE